MAKNKEPEVLQFTNRQIEAEEYLKNHKINELFANITSHLVFNKPGTFNYLNRLKIKNIC